jgi:hypothetical protein
LYIAYEWTDSDSSGTQNAGDSLVEGFTESGSTIGTISIGSTYDFKFYADDTSTGWESYAGKGIVTGISRSVAHDGMAEMSVTIQGNSALT